MWEYGASDLLLVCGSPPRVRIDGQLRPLEMAPPVPADVDAFVRSLIPAKHVAEFDEMAQVDFSMGWKGRGRMRANAFRQRGTTALALRSIPHAIPSLDDIGAPAGVRRFLTVPYGLVLVTGPTGSGKSTTLAGMIDLINSTRPVHILTIEDPIEYLHTHKMAAVSQREVGLDTPSFASALRAALREDPDVILLGEMRDPETISTALTLAETGHLVFATLHTNDAAQSLDRIVGVFPSDRREQIQVMLAGTLQGIISQRLLPRIGGGRVAAFEILVATEATRNLVREGKTRQIRNIITTGRAESMQTIEHGLTELVRTGVITREAAESISQYPREILAAGRGAPMVTPAAAGARGR
jgi:twitching motility protein PilT